MNGPGYEVGRQYVLRSTRENSFDPAATPPQEALDKSQRHGDRVVLEASTQLVGSYHAVMNLDVSGPADAETRAELKVVSRLFADSSNLEEVEDAYGLCPKLVGNVVGESVEKALHDPGQDAAFRRLYQEASNLNGRQSSAIAKASFEDFCRHVACNIMNHPLTQPFCGIGGSAKSVVSEVLSFMT